MQLFLFFFILILLVITIYDILLLKIAPTPTFKKVADQLFEMLPSSIDGPIYELGSGFGTLTLKLSKRYPDTQIVAIEKAILPFLVSKLLFWICRVKNVDLKFQDFRKISLKEGQYFICYLYREIMPLIAQKIEKETTSCSWLITHTFAVSNRFPTQLAYSKDLYCTPIYLYHFVKR